jgi:hypothetical protein
MSYHCETDLAIGHTYHESILDKYMGMRYGGAVK